MECLKTIFPHRTVLSVAPATVDGGSAQQKDLGRLVGTIWLGDRDINRELVREGYAWAYRDYLQDQSLLDDEAKARSEAVGLWSDPNPVAPWRWRRGDRSPTSVSSTPAQPFTCGSKRYCREMTSCDEAMFYLRECGLTWLDGDSDGVPCEAICR